MDQANSKRGSESVDIGAWQERSHTCPLMRARSYLTGMTGCGADPVGGFFLTCSCWHIVDSAEFGIVARRCQRYCVWTFWVPDWLLIGETRLVLWLCTLQWLIVLSQFSSKGFLTTQRRLQQPGCDQTAPVLRSKACKNEGEAREFFKRKTRTESAFLYLLYCGHSQYLNCSEAE